jgi:hypothetical protein
MSKIKLPVREWPYGGVRCGMSIIRVVDVENREVCQVRRLPTDTADTFQARVGALVDAINGVGRLVDTHA